MTLLELLVTIAGAFGIFIARVADVSLGTLRTISVVRGRIAVAWVLALFEITIWVLAAAHVLKHLDNVFNVMGYAFGFATGNAVGILLERRLAMGTVVLRLISRTHGEEIAEAMREGGQPVTIFRGEGRDGPVSLLYILAPRKDIPLLIEEAKVRDSEVFFVTEDARQASKVLKPFGFSTGWRSPFKRK